MECAKRSTSKQPIRKKKQTFEADREEELTLQGRGRKRRISPGPIDATLGERGCTRDFTSAHGELHAQRETRERERATSHV